LVILVVAFLFLGAFAILGGYPNSNNDQIWGVGILALSVATGAYLLLSGRMDRFELSTRKENLQLQLRIAELEDKIRSE
ncbi:MAG: hypothetical protein ACYTET_07760, partial [Planctomycetota bacterium]